MVASPQGWNSRSMRRHPCWGGGPESSGHEEGTEQGRSSGCNRSSIIFKRADQPHKDTENDRSQMSPGQRRELQIWKEKNPECPCRGGRMVLEKSI